MMPTALQNGKAGCIGCCTTGLGFGIAKGAIVQTDGCASGAGGCCVTTDPYISDEENALLSILEDAGLPTAVNDRCVNIVRGLVARLSPEPRADADSERWSWFCRVAPVSVRARIAVMDEDAMQQFVDECRKLSVTKKPEHQAVVVPRCNDDSHDMRSSGEPDDDHLYCHVCGIADYQLRKFDDSPENGSGGE